MQASVHLDTQHNVGAIDRRLFGGFLEHLGRAVYEGIYDPGNPLSDARGFRRDVLDVLGTLHMPIVRYPGGNFVSCYDWRDGIGPRERRPSRPDYAWRSLESNQFGTDEFMAWCKEMSTEPMLAVNLGTAGSADAAALLEYCNLPAGSYWADRRREHGHPEPYGVKLWCLGNEMDGPWQAGHVPAEVYAQRAGQASLMMKGLDPTIETVACGSSNDKMPTYMQWDRTVLEYCWDAIDFISAHRYSGNKRQDSAEYLADGIDVERMLVDYTSLLGYARAVKKSDKRVHLSFDEWNVWYRAREGAAVDGNWARAPHLLEEHYNLEDALVCAQYLTAFLRHADIVKVACLAQIVNVIAPVLTRPDGLLLQSIFHPFALISKLAAGHSLTPITRGPSYKAGGRGETPVLDAAATHDQAAETVSLFLINRSQRDDLRVEIDVADRRFSRVLSVDLLGGGDVQAANTWETPHRVAPVKGEGVLDENGRLHVRVPAPGLAVVHAALARYAVSP